MITPDIRNDYLNNEKPSKEYYKIKVDVSGYVINFCWLSSEVAAQFGIPLDRMLSWDEFMNNLERLPIEPICGECFREWLNKK